MNLTFEKLSDGELMRAYFLGCPKPMELQQAIERELVRRGYRIDNIRLDLDLKLGEFMEDKRNRFQEEEIEEALTDIETRQAGFTVWGG